MFHPDWEEGCPSCTAGVAEVAPGFLEHLHTRDTTYALVSRAPLEKLQRWSDEQRFVVPWYSTNDGDFSYDFGATVDASRGYDEYNFRTLDEYAAIGRESMRDSEQPYDMPGQSCFLRVDDRIFHTYSVYARGPRVARRLLLLPRQHRPRPPGGLGGAEGPQRQPSAGTTRTSRP